MSQRPLVGKHLNRSWTPFKANITITTTSHLTVNSHLAPAWPNYSEIQDQFPFLRRTHSDVSTLWSGWHLTGVPWGGCKTLKTSSEVIFPPAPLIISRRVQAVLCYAGPAGLRSAKCCNVVTTLYLLRSSLRLRCATFHWSPTRRWSRGCDPPLVSSPGPDPLGLTAALGLSLD